MSCICNFLGDINTVRFLLALGAKANQPSLAGQTPLHLAVLAGDLALTELLLEKGADLKVIEGTIFLKIKPRSNQSKRVKIVEHPTLLRFKDLSLTVNVLLKFKSLIN